MLRTYFVHIAAVRMLAARTGQKLYDNYAFHGALGRFSAVDIGDIHNTDGIDDVPEKAESFKFGQACGRILAQELAVFSEEELQLYDAAVARGIFIKPGAELTLDKHGKQLKTILRAVFKYAQIQTHTAKPGYEDINAWLVSYKELLDGFEPCLDLLVELMLTDDAEVVNKMTAFFNTDDPVIKAAMQGKACEKAVEPVCVFGKMLKVLR